MHARKNISNVVFPWRPWSFITSTLKSLTIRLIWLALSSVIYSQIVPLFALSGICSKSHHSCSKSYHFCFKSHHFFLYRITSVSNNVKAFFNSAISKWLQRSGNWTSCRAILVWNHTCGFKSSILKSRVWLQTKLHSTQFNYHYKSYEILWRRIKRIFIFLILMTKRQTNMTF